MQTPRFLRASSSIRVDQGSPFDGVGASGYGREMGFEAMREYTSPKSISVNVGAQLAPFAAGEVMSKIMSLKEAIATFVKDGDTVAMEGFTHLIPNAAGHEIVRQRRRDLTLVRMTPDLIYDQLIGMGVAAKLIFSWGGNPGVGSLHRLRDAVERGWPRPLEIEERAHADMASAYAAGASGLPFAVLRAYAGTDIPKYTAVIKQITCPFTGEKLAATPSIRPDVAIIHAQQADRKGNVLLWGILGVQKEAVLAARRAIVTVEEVVDDFNVEPARNAVILPSWVLSGVACVPSGAAPSYAHGYYARDNSFYKAWDRIARERDTFLAWMRENVLEAHDFAEFQARQKGVRANAVN